MKRLIRQIPGFLALASTIIGLTCALPLQAETITQNEAKKVARLFFNAAYSRQLPDPQYIFNGKRLTTDRLFTPFYVFNSPEGGFVIISAENKAFPILGYQLSATGTGFPKTGPSDAERQELLRGFARDIELIRYDPRHPSEAAEAWENLPLTINDILDSPEILNPDFYRYRSENDEQWILRRRAVEFPYEWPKTDAEIEIERLASIVPEEEPFSFYDNFIIETRREAEAKASALDEMLSPTRPIIKNLGGAHFIIDTPEEIRMFELFNGEGALMTRLLYHGGRLLPVDLSIFPSGFYIARIVYADGKWDGIKLYR